MSDRLRAGDNGKRALPIHLEREPHMNPSEPLPAALLLAHNLRRLRDERGLSIDDLAGRTGVAAKRLATIEAATSQALIDEVGIIALGLGVRIAALFATE
ncbi:helix-turn-helix domain-containing protein [Bosea beijingensis]|uniref:helix-turn-helix domain-containing protein n=1 Tax=Bosea beijingensis TaxID=3068632 RepID=UPI002740F2BE|nr:helix-turn-helix transcriptional regulator [Bosea sp. REN20]